MDNKIAVYGAYGHTGKFIVSELLRQGYNNLVLVGRDSQKLTALRDHFQDVNIKTADITNSGSLDDAFSGAEIIINCAGPYLDTAAPIIKSALRSGSHYIDLTAEQKSVLDIFAEFSAEAKNKDILVIPAAAFYGGLADLLATELTRNWDHTEEINVYIGLDSWHPTKGTRLTGDRNHYKRLIFKNKKLQELQDTFSKEWDFEEPIGIKEVVTLPLSEIITISSHLNVNEVNTFLSQNSLNDLRSASTPEPKPVDEKNRSSQQFSVDVTAQNGSKRRKISAKGRDIYAVTAPIVVEAVKRILLGKITRKGVATLGEVFEAHDFLNSLDADDIKIGLIEETDER